MAAIKKPGTNTGNRGGIYRQVSPWEVKRGNLVTVPDRKPLLPTAKPGEGWTQVKQTPDSKR